MRVAHDVFDLQKRYVLALERIHLLQTMLAIMPGKPSFSDALRRRATSASVGLRWYYASNVSIMISQNCTIHRNAVDSYRPISSSTS